ncbi:MAG: hypothetical protein K1X57_23050, partial [Gemmataceae bacterium]|nr:hypothetical protein [Gemmataceae bacterium]
WTEGFGQSEYRQTKGSRRYQLVGDFFDEISGFSGDAPDTAFAGFRIAAVPGPCTLAVPAIFLVFKRRAR